jgi:hypothetical protein
MKQAQDESLNIEYLRNVIIKFLEKKTTRVRQDSTFSQCFISSYFLSHNWSPSFLLFCSAHMKIKPNCIKLYKTASLSDSIPPPLSYFLLIKNLDSSQPKDLLSVRSPNTLSITSRVALFSTEGGLFNKKREGMGLKEEVEWFPFGGGVFESTRGWKGCHSVLDPASHRSSFPSLLLSKLTPWMFSPFLGWSTNDILCQTVHDLLYAYRMSLC